jgi:hypothetical protein
VATGGTAPQFQFWVQRVGGPFTLLCAYSASATCSWTPSVAGDYFVFVWARSAGSSATFEADRVISFQVGGVSGPQVRFFNNLLVNGQPFTAELQAAQGNVWFSSSGVFSLYQPSQRVLGPFELRGTLVATFPGTFTLPTTGSQFFTIVLTLQNNQLALGLLQDAAPAAEVGEVDVSVAVFLQMLPATEPVPRIEDYQLKQR